MSHCQKVASKRNLLMILSTGSSKSLEEVAKYSQNGNLWFQLYVYKDRKLSESLVKRAEKAGYKALVLTVDLPVFGNRLANSRNKFAVPSHIKYGNFLGQEADVELNSVSSESQSYNLQDYIENHYDRSLTWEALSWLKGITTLPIYCKGILTPEDAELALQHGASGIIVSNHGGRQLDSVPPTIVALPPIVKAVKGRCPLIIDGGIRKGTDVLKALALGASMVLIGRPVLHGLAIGGEIGLEHAVDILIDETKRAMTLAGCPTLKDITPAVVTHRSNLISHL